MIETGAHAVAKLSVQQFCFVEAECGRSIWLALDKRPMTGKRISHDKRVLCAVASELSATSHCARSDDGWVLDIKDDRNKWRTELRGEERKPRTLYSSVLFGRDKESDAAYR
jgi:hypothetical protein